VDWWTIYQSALASAGVSDGSQRITDPDQIVDLLDILQKSYYATTTRSNTLSKTFSAERVAQLRADVDASKALVGAYTDLESVKGRNRDAYMAAFSRVEAAIVNAEARLAASAGAENNAAMRSAEKAYGVGGPAQVWADLVGYIDQQGQAMSDTQIRATILALAKTYPDMLDMEAFNAGDYKAALAPVGGLASAIGARAERLLADAAVVGQQQDAARLVIEQARGDVMGARSRLEGAPSTLSDADIQAVRDPALAGLKALQSNPYFNAVDAAQQLRTYEDADSTLQQMEQFRNQVFGMIGAPGTASESDMARIMKTPGFQQWATDRGFKVGTVNQNGRYLAGAQDMRALLAYGREFRRGDREYDQVFVPHTTGDAIRVRVGEDPVAPIRVAGADSAGNPTHYYDSGSGTVYTFDDAGALVTVEGEEAQRRAALAQKATVILTNGAGQVATLDDLRSPDAEVGIAQGEEAATAISATPPKPRYIVTERLRTSARDLSTQGSKIAYVDPETGEPRLADAADVEVVRSGTQTTMRQDAANLRRGDAADEAARIAAGISGEVVGKTPGGAAVLDGANDPTATQQRRAAGEAGGEDDGSADEDEDSRSLRDRLRDLMAGGGEDSPGWLDRIRDLRERIRNREKREREQKKRETEADIAAQSERNPLPAEAPADTAPAAPTTAPDPADATFALPLDAAGNPIPRKPLDITTTPGEGTNRRPAEIMVLNGGVVRYDPNTGAIHRQAIPGLTVPTPLTGQDAHALLNSLPPEQTASLPSMTLVPDTMREAVISALRPAGGSYPEGYIEGSPAAPEMREDNARARVSRPNSVKMIKSEAGNFLMTFDKGKDQYSILALTDREVADLPVSDSGAPSFADRAALRAWVLRHNLNDPQRTPQIMARDVLESDSPDLASSFWQDEAEKAKEAEKEGAQETAGTTETPAPETVEAPVPDATTGAPVGPTEIDAGEGTISLDGLTGPAATTEIDAGTGTISLDDIAGATPTPETDAGGGDYNVTNSTVTPGFNLPATWDPVPQPPKYAPPLPKKNLLQKAREVFRGRS
jgi:hypothetical protein